MQQLYQCQYFYDFDPLCHFFEHSSTETKIEILTFVLALVLPSFFRKFSKQSFDETHLLLKFQSIAFHLSHSLREVVVLCLCISLHSSEIKSKSEKNLSSVRSVVECLMNEIEECFFQFDCSDFYHSFLFTF